MRSGGNLFVTSVLAASPIAVARAGSSFGSASTTDASGDTLTLRSPRGRNFVVSSDGFGAGEGAAVDPATGEPVELTGDAANFRLVIVLSADHDDREVFTRTWDETIPRQWA